MSILRAQRQEGRVARVETPEFSHMFSLVRCLDLSTRKEGRVAHVETPEFSYMFSLVICLDLSTA
jgi:hypothetical protein